MAYNNIFPLFQYQVKAEPVTVPAAPTPPATGPAVAAVAVSHEGPPPSLLDIQYQAKTEPVLVPSVAPPVTSVDRWFQPFAEPVRTRAMPAALQEKLFYTTVVLPVPSIGYFEPLSEPTRPKPLLVASQKEFFFGSYAPTAPPTIPSINYLPWSEPVRQRPGLGVAQQKDF